MGTFKMLPSFFYYPQYSLNMAIEILLLSSKFINMAIEIKFLFGQKFILFLFLFFFLQNTNILDGMWHDSFLVS